MVVVILAANVAVIAYFMRGQEDANAKASQEGVTISSEVLNSLGVSKTPVGTRGAELVVGPNSRFNSKVTIGGDVSIAGQLQLNSKFSASDASLSKLTAGNVDANQLSTSGDIVATNINARRDINVAGTTRLQGAVNINQLLTVNNNANILGNLSIGGSLSVRTFQASSLTSDATLTIGGHIVTRGNAPGVSPGPAVGSNGTASASGNDASGTVAVNTGVGAGNGTLAQVTFRSPYDATPHVVVTPVGAAVPGLYIHRSATGFSIAVSGAVAPGGYAFDYMVMQ